MTRRTLAVTLTALLALTLIPLPAFGGQSLGSRVAKALSTAKRAERTAEQALQTAQAVTTVQGPQGAQGATGATGSQGAQGIASLNIASAMNPSDSRVGTLQNITAATTMVQADPNPSGNGFVLAEAQVTETAGYATPLACWITLDGATYDRRDFDLPQNGKVLVTVSHGGAIPGGPAKLVCQRTSGATDAVPKVLAGDGRISVLGG